MAIKISDRELSYDVIKLRVIDKEIKSLKERHEELKKKITKAMGDADVLANEDGEYLCTYSASATFRKIDLEQLAFCEPELHSRLMGEYGYESKAFKTFRLAK